MGRRISTAPIKFDITGLEPRIFELCRQNKQEIIEQRGKGRIVSSSSSANPSDVLDDLRREPELASLTKNELIIYNRVVSIAIDFQRAYGRTVTLRVYRRSSNKFLNALFGGRPKSQGNASGDLKPSFFVNGIKVFVGVPSSFSELDEAIDRVFGRHLGSGRAELV
jgi:hypothetical protein